MKKNLFKYHVWFYLIVLIITRYLAYLAGIKFDYNGIFSYWQYLSVDTLKYNLLNGIWFNHSQPPLFNLFLGIILKTFGGYSHYVFQFLFLLISYFNTLLLFRILNIIKPYLWLTIIIPLIYLISPATIIFENELFYTSIISFLFLVSIYVIIKIQDSISWSRSVLLFAPLVLICLTRSFYHFIFYLTIGILILFLFRRRDYLIKLTVVYVFGFLIVISWYFKNYIIFSKFSTSSWVGMNLARNVFHDADTNSMTGISHIEPFSSISKYSHFIDESKNVKFKGLNDPDLFSEFKNKGFQNMNHISYLQVSDEYMIENKRFIFKHPLMYARNIVQSAITFFAPATRYPTMERQSRKLAYYDVLFSFNLSHFAENKFERRIALVLSAIPKICVYSLIFLYFISGLIKGRKIPVYVIFGAAIIVYNFVLGIFLEHYENMRFRYETEPIFYVVLFYFIALRTSSHLRFIK